MTTKSTPEPTRQEPVEPATEPADLDPTASSTPAPQDGSDGDDDSLPAWVREKLAKANREAAKYRTEAKDLRSQIETEAEAKRKAELTAEERAREAEAKAERAERDAAERVLAAERRAALAGKVTKPERVLALIGTDDVERYFDGATPNLEAILADFGEYAPDAAGAGSSTAPAAARGAASAAPRSPASIEEQSTQALRSGNLLGYASLEAERQRRRLTKG
jgi:hypothetical protein